MAQHEGAFLTIGRHGGVAVCHSDPRGLDFSRRLSADHSPKVPPGFPAQLWEGTADRAWLDRGRLGAKSKPDYVSQVIVRR